MIFNKISVMDSFTNFPQVMKVLHKPVSPYTVESRFNVISTESFNEYVHCSIHTHYNQIYFQPFFFSNIPLNQLSLALCSTCCNLPKVAMCIYISVMPRNKLVMRNMDKNMNKNNNVLAHTYTHTHTHTHSLSLSLSHTHTHIYINHATTKLPLCKTITYNKI
jgi:hypothetical protein